MQFLAKIRQILMPLKFPPTPWGILHQQYFHYQRVFNEFATTLDNNRLAFQSTVSLKLHTSSDMVLEGDIIITVTVK